MISYRRVKKKKKSSFFFSRNVQQLLIVQVNVHLILSCLQSDEENLHVCICFSGTRGWFARRQYRSVADKRHKAATIIQKGKMVLPV